MRSARTQDESFAIDKVISFLGESFNEDSEFQDKPDLVLENSSGLRIACELSMVGLNEWYRWKNDFKKQLGINELDVFAVPREPHIWVQNILKKKNSKIQSYLDSSSSKEAWLIVHSTESEVYDLFVLDEDYDLALMKAAALESNHSFKKIFVVSAVHGVREIFPGKKIQKKTPKITLSKLPHIQVKAQQIQTHSGVNTLTLGDEFTPDRFQRLPPLGSYKK